MDLMMYVFWFCWTLFFGLIFADRVIKGIKRFVVHFYFRGQAHFDVETDYNNKEQLKQIEKLLEGFRVNFMFHLSDSKKTTTKRLEITEARLKIIEQLLTEIRNELDRED